LLVAFSHVIQCFFPPCLMFFHSLLGIHCFFPQF
jgi:hypothetical protein